MCVCVFKCFWADNLKKSSNRRQSVFIFQVSAVNIFVNCQKLLHDKNTY